VVCQVFSAFGRQQYIYGNRSGRLHCDKIGPAQLYAFLADYVFGGSLDFGDAAAKDDYFHAIMPAEVNMHRANRLQQP
jgi:hypothetical protein